MIAGTEFPLRTLFVLEAVGRIKVAGGEEHDLPLSDQDNRDLLDQLEAASAHASNDIVLQDFKSYAKDDLVFKGASHNPHSPVAIDIVHLPLMSELSKKALKTIRPLLKKEPGIALGLSEDVVAMTVLGKMQPDERTAIGITPSRVVVNTCERAQEMAKEYEKRRHEVAAKLAAAMKS